MMKLLVVGAFLALVLCVVAKEKKSSMLLGADDVDKKYAQMSSLSAPQVPESIADVKKKAKQDRAQLRTLKHRVHELKRQIKDKKTSLGNTEIKQLKEQYKLLKGTMKSKKHEIIDLKKKLYDMKSDKRAQKHSKKGGHRRGGRRNKLEKGQVAGKEEKKINSPESFGLKPLSQNQIPVSKNNRKAQRKQNKKGGRRRNRQKIDQDLKIRSRGKQMMLSDAPRLRSGVIDRLSLKPSKGGHRYHKKKLCTTDSDCVRGKCLPNKRGRKVCRVTDKSAGEKCHKSEVCSRDLRCYVSKAPLLLSKPNRIKGVCADPKTVDLTNGYLIPYKS